MFNKKRLDRIEEKIDRLECDLWKQANPPRHNDGDKVYHIKNKTIHKATITESMVSYYTTCGFRVYYWLYNLDNISQNYISGSELITKEDLKHV